MQKKEKSRESYTKWHKRRNKNKNIMRLFNTFMAKSNQAGRRTRVTNNNITGELSNRTIIYLERRAKLQGSR